MRICGIEPESIVDGPGFRYVLFVQGCPHHCNECHNPESWDFNAGIEMSVDEIYNDIKNHPHDDGVTFSGGEPFCQVHELLELAKKIKADGYSLYSYSGFTYEELIARNDRETNELLSFLDVLIDGRYVKELRNLTLLYRGSENQRLIDLRKTTPNNIVLFDPEENWRI